MHILLAALGVLGVAAFWWYRIKTMNEAAGEVVDTVGRVRGSLRRKKQRQKAELSPITAIDRPLIAAATVVTAIVCEESAMTPRHEQALRDALSEVGETAAVDEAVIYAKWAVGQIDDGRTVVDKLAAFLNDQLDEVEKDQLLAIIRRVAATDPAAQAAAEPLIRRLRQKLGFEMR